MTTMTADAQQLFDRYLQTVRWSLRGVRGAEEIERDVREHVDSALQEQSAPVTAHTLREVLARLGDPWQWMPIDEMPWWRRIVMRFWLGPEDWRLAYLCFALTILGMATLPLGIGFPLLIGAYVTARATVSLATDRGEPLDARKWLVYLPLVVFALFLGVAMVVGPPLPLAALAIEHDGLSRLFGMPIHTPPLIIAAVTVMFGVWWIVLSGIVAVAIRPIRAIFAPFGQRWHRVHALWLFALGIITAGGGAAALFAGW